MPEEEGAAAIGLHARTAAQRTLPARPPLVRAGPSVAPGASATAEPLDRIAVRPHAEHGAVGVSTLLDHFAGDRDDPHHALGAVREASTFSATFPFPKQVGVPP